MLASSWRGATVAAAALAGSAAIAACGSGPNASYSPAAGYDAGSDASNGAGDSGAPDAGGSARAPSALFVHASPSATHLGPVRLCWQTSAGMTTTKPFPSSIMPASNYAGLPVGGAAFLRDASELVGSGDVTLYAIDARQLAALEQDGVDHPCNELVCDSGCLLEPNKQYWTLGTVPAAAFAGNGSSVLAIEGCLYSALDSQASTARCGADWQAATGNLHAQVLPVAPSSAGELSVQVAQLSPGLSALLGSGESASLSLGTAAAPEAPIATVDAEGQIAPSQPVALDFDASLPDYGQLGIRIDVGGVDAGAGAGAGDLFMTLVQAQQLVDPSVDPVTYYGAGGTYVVAVVGDPDAPHAFAASPDGGAYDGTGLHVLVVAAQPPP